MNNVSQSSWRATAAVVVQSLLWLWLISLSVFAVLNHQTMNNLADRERVDSSMQRLETQIARLTETTKALQQRPAAATASGLQDIRQALDARIAHIEQTLFGLAAMDDLQALRAEVEQIKTRQAPAKPRSQNKPTAAKPEPTPLPFRIVGAELRAGQRSVSVAPSSGNFTADQVQVLLPGDAVGSWRLQPIDGNTAVFQDGEKTRSVAIP
ncbi:hypothetical protein ISN34_12495 [Xanthomonas translucens pv. translucens]|uniref:Uncharacterized protein n=2 Tax=Xanthomonas campestris pv. translucens TaxID=343 RepID=A0A120EYU2_XANCT|nr:hypothetical protein [Xanthomonas translucens]KWV16564.1 hypothetical protein ATB53_02490 [Xanthomonas translucens]QSQ35307.1 hypothetical protein ISN31_07110 [Xanthomonas translucens pv. translucens]QSQ44111.1 hypothetical protein ISN34_12495 [Xanthomonas translucens pv. translucens]